MVDETLRQTNYERRILRTRLMMTGAVPRSKRGERHGKPNIIKIKGEKTNDYPLQKRT